MMVTDFKPHDYKRLQRIYIFMFDLLKEEYEKWYAPKASEGMSPIEIIDALENVMVAGHIASADKVKQ